MNARADAPVVRTLVSMPARRIGAAAASTASRLQRTAALDLIVSDATYRLTWTALSEPPFTTVLGVGIGAHDFDILLDDLGIVPELAPQVMRTLSESARLVAASFLLEPLIDLLQTATARPVVLTSVSYRRTEQPAPDGVGFLIERPGSNAVRRGCVVPRDPAAWSLLESLARARPTIPPSDADLPVCVRLVLGTTRLTLSRLEGLAAGWVVLVLDIAAGERGFALASDRGEVLGRFRIERGSRFARRIEMETDVKLTVIEDVEDAGGGIDDIELELEFELGRTLVGLATLRDIAPGQVLELDRPIEACRVAIRCGHRRIGAGELVELDGRLGVRVLTIERRE